MKKVAAALALVCVSVMAAPARAWDPTNKIVVTGTVEDVVPSSAFVVNADGVLIVFPCPGVDPQAGCEKLSPQDNILVRAHFDDIAPDCEGSSGRNPIVLDSISVFL